MKIKYRVWSKKHNNIVQLCESITDLYRISQEESFSYILKPINDNFTIQVFTGLRDKNGVEIYEGDILNGEEWFAHRSPAWGKLRNVIVVWDKLSSCFSLDYKFMGVPIAGNSHYTYNKLEVIGNVLKNMNYNQEYYDTHIDCAAVKTTDGRIFTGKRHCHCFGNIKTAGLKPSHKDQGFCTMSGLYVTREEAAALVLKTGQCKLNNPPLLYSEDLY